MPLLAVLALALLSSSVVALASPAAASVRAEADSAPSPDEGSATDTPSPAPTESTAPPTAVPVEITSPPDGHFSSDGRITVEGKAPEGSTVTVTPQENGSSPCTTTADPETGDFSCDAVTIPGSSTVTITAAAGDASDSVTVDVLLPPTLDKTSFVTNGPVSGLAFPGAKVTATASNGDSCTVENVAASGQWSCALEGTTGSASGLTVAATQSATMSASEARISDASAASRLTLDRDAPQPPTITSPSADAPLPTDGVTFTGTAEDGATVSVFVGAGVVCSAVASGGAWSCVSGAVAAGEHEVVAVAKDAAGNASGNGAVIVYAFGTQTSSGTPTTTPAPGTTAPPSTEAAPPPEEETPGSSPPSEAAPAQPDRGAPGPWDLATPFTAELTPALGAGSIAGWLRAALLAFTALVLLYVPARMIAASVGRRRARTTPALTGRNRGAAESDAPSLLLSGPGRITACVLGVVAAGALLIFANPVTDEPAYLRVLIAACVATGAVTLVSVWVPRILSHAWQAGYAEARLDPHAFLLVVAAVLASRLLELHPAVLFAVVVAIRVPSVLSGALLARLALARTDAVFGVGVAAWLFSAVVPTGEFVPTLVLEAANITALAGVGSATIMLLPLGKLSGRAIYGWSRPIWFASALVALTVLFVMLSPTVELWQGSAGMLTTLAVVLGFAAFGAALWLWKRYVQPNLS